MSGKSSERRQRMGRALVGFAGVMCLFTVLSRVSASLSTAVVTVEYPSEKRIEHMVTGQGTVEEKLEFAVLTESALLVKAVYVKAGQSVAKGEVLAELDVADVEEQKKEKQEEIEILELTNQGLRETQERAEVNAEQAKTRAAEDYEQAAAESELEVAAAAAELDRATEAYNAYDAALTADISEDAFRQLLELENAMQTAQRAYDAALLRQESALREAWRAIEDAEELPAEETGIAINEIRIAQLERELSRLQEIRETDGKILAPTAGIVTSVYIQTGQRTTDTAALTMADITAGMHYTVQIEKKEAQNVSLGDTVTLKRNGMVQGEFAVDVMENLEDGSVLVTVDITGTGAEQFSVGDMLEMEIKQTAPLSRTVVPLTALHEENERYYVYVPQEMETVLGEEYRVARIEVEVTDKNDRYAAIKDGMLSGEMQIIVDSDRYIEAGSKVCLQTQ